MIGTGLTKYRDWGLLVLRVGLGVAFMIHGWPKLTGGPRAWVAIGHSGGFYFIPMFWGFVAGLIEFGGGLLVALGLLFRPACAFLVLQMAAALSFHLRSTNPMLNNYGMYSHAIEDGIVFMSLLLIGPGKYSVDKK